MQKIGIRIELGTKHWDGLRMLLGQGLLLAVKELAADAIAAILLVRISSGSSHLLFGVGSDDPATLVTDSAVLLAIAAAA